MSNKHKPMKITHALKENQQFTVDELEVGEVFTLDIRTLIMGHNIMGTGVYSCWDIEASTSVRVPAGTVVKQRVNAELILS